MKKALLLVVILFLSVVSTACINNFAVQELNAKAKAYLDAGKYQEAIERLKSSVDLDDTIFETHYNLAVAYTQAEDYANAIEAYKNAINLNPDFADAYYSLAVAQGNLAVDLETGAVLVDEFGNMTKAEEIDTEYKPSKEVLEMVANINNEAISNYEIYLQKAPESEDADEVRAKIKSLKGEDDNKLAE